MRFFPSFEDCRVLLQGRVGRRWFVVGLLGSAMLDGLSAEVPRDEKRSRLGFKFDQQVHDAAVAARARRMIDAPPDADVIRMPKYTVTEQRIPLEEHELLTPEGKLAVAKERYLNPAYQKTLGPVMAIATFLNNPLGGWSPNAPEAMAIYEDFEMRRRNRRLAELTKFVQAVERAKAPVVKPPAAQAKR